MKEEKKDNIGEQGMCIENIFIGGWGGWEMIQSFQGMKGTDITLAGYQAITERLKYFCNLRNGFKITSKEL